METLKNLKEYSEIIGKDKPVVLDFYADWCGPCQSLLPTVEKLAVEYGDRIEIRKVNVDQNKDLAGYFQVRSIPSLFFIRDSKVVDQQTGMIPEANLRVKLESLMTI